ncbi:SWIB/MDM2 domain [Dillenia turbinata]|uniref:SWIB/MDM2 domain n=1 Tax=Dillenia turbinata TaxID=194707 RepID=A0AAN8WDG7_9MAGN
MSYFVYDFRTSNEVDLDCFARVQIDLGQNHVVNYRKPDSTFPSIRVDKGLYEICMKTVTAVEMNEQRDNKMKFRVDFSNADRWEHLFRVYWKYLKKALSLTSNVLTQAKCAEKMSDTENKQVGDASKRGSGSAKDVGSRETEYLGKESNAMANETVPLSGTSILKPCDTKRRGSGSSPKDEVCDANKRASWTAKNVGTSNRWKLNLKQDLVPFAINAPTCIAVGPSKEPEEFVAQVKHGNTSALSQLGVRALLLEYISGNNLRHHHNSLIVCGSKLEKLFGKKFLRHFEMLNLLDEHFLLLT